MAKKQKNIKEKTIEKLRVISDKYKNNIGDILSSDEFREAYSDMNYKEKEFCQIMLEGIIDGKSNEDIKNIAKAKEEEPAKSIVDEATDEDRAKEVLFGAQYYVDSDEDETEMTSAEEKLVEDTLGVKSDSEKHVKTVVVEPQVEKFDEKVKVNIRYLSDVEKGFGSKAKIVKEVVVDDGKPEEKVSVIINTTDETEPVTITITKPEETEEPTKEEVKEEPKVEFISDVKAKKEEAKQEGAKAEEPEEKPIDLAMYGEVIIEETDHNGVFRTTKSFNTDKAQVFETVPGVPLSKLEQNQLWFLKNVFPEKYKEVMAL